MEIIKCTKNKLKVIFTEEDMKKYRIKASALDYNDKNNRRIMYASLYKIDVIQIFVGSQEKIARDTSLKTPLISNLLHDFCNISAEKLQHKMLAYCAAY